MAAKKKPVRAAAVDRRIENWPIEKLIPYENNARTHSAEQVTKIAASIAEFGFTNPILASKAGIVIAGHGRLEAAKHLGLREVPVLVLPHLTEKQRRALTLADNRLAEDAGWDYDKLAHELDELHEEGFNLSVIGFTREELNDLIGTPNTALDKSGKTQEIDVDGFKMKHKCPKCKFEFDDKK